MESYEFKDLSQQAQTNALNLFYDINITDEWDIEILNKFNNNLHVKTGIINSKIVYVFDENVNQDLDILKFRTLISFEYLELDRGFWIFEGMNIDPDDMKVKISGYVKDEEQKYNITLQYKKKLLKSFSKKLINLVSDNLNKMFDSINEKLHESLVIEYNRLIEPTLVRETLINSNILFHENGNEYIDDNHICTIEDILKSIYIGKVITVAVNGGKCDASIITDIELLTTRNSTNNNSSVKIVISDHSEVESFTIERSELNYLFNNGCSEIKDTINGDTLELGVIEI